METAFTIPSLDFPHICLGRDDNEAATIGGEDMKGINGNGKNN